MPHQFTGVVQAEVTTVVDARGRVKEFAVVRCPGPCKGMIIGLRGLEPCHLTFEETADLVEQLRAGPGSPKLKASPYQSGRMFAVTNCQLGRYVLAYDFDGRLDVIIAGGPVENVPLGMSALLTTEQRTKWADVIERELGLNTGDLSGRAGARA